MQTLKGITAIAAGVIFSFCTISGSFAQGQPPQQQQQQPPQQQQQQTVEISEEDFETFLEVAQEMQGMQEEVEEERNDILEEHDLDMQKFNRLMQAQQNPEMADDFSDEEMQSFEEAYQEIQQLSQKQNEKLQEVLADAGWDMQKFQQMQQGIQQDPELIERYQEEIEQ